MHKLDEKALAAALEVHMSWLPEDGPPGETDDENVTRQCKDCCEQTIRAYLAAAPSPAPVAVKIKPLEWEEISEHEPGWWAAQTGVLFVGYEVRVNSRGVVRVRFPCKAWETFAGTVDDAKDAAQADYEARIRSALVPADEAGGQT